VITLGPWRLTRRLGGGGMGVVYAAEHGVHRIAAAVKLLRPGEGDDALATASLQYELEALGRLRHPGIAMLLDVGTVPSAEAVAHPQVLHDGGLYLVSERIEGGQLRARCGQLSASEVQAVLLGLLDALAHAHARGILHLDLKPDNVLLAGRASLRPVLVDFGLSFRKGSARGAWRSSGTPAYMAPERYLGDWRRFGPPTDLYALGCMAVHLLVGAPPFRGSAEQIRAQILGDAPVLPAELEVPQGLRDFVERCAAHSPADRYPTAAAAAAALAPLDLTQACHDPWSSEAGAQPTLGFDTVSFDLTEEVPRSVGMAAAAGLAPLPDEAPRVRGLLPPAAALRFGVPGLAVAAQQPVLASAWSALRRVEAERQAARWGLGGGHRLDRAAVVRWLGERVGERGWRWLAVRSGETLTSAVGRWLDLDDLAGDALVAHLAERLGGGGAWAESLADALRSGRGAPVASAAVLAVAAVRPVLLSVADDASLGAHRWADTLVGQAVPVLVVGGGDDALLSAVSGRDALLQLTTHVGVAPEAAQELVRWSGGSLAVAESLVVGVARRRGWLPGREGLRRDPSVPLELPASLAGEVPERWVPWLRLAAVLGELDEPAVRDEAVARLGLGLPPDDLPTALQTLAAEPAWRRQLLHDVPVAVPRAVAAALGATGVAAASRAPHEVAAGDWQAAQHSVSEGAWRCYLSGDLAEVSVLLEAWEQVTQALGPAVDRGCADRILRVELLHGWRDKERCAEHAERVAARAHDPSLAALARVYAHAGRMRIGQVGDAAAFARHLAEAEAVDDPWCRCEATWAASVWHDLHDDMVSKRAALARSIEHGRVSDEVFVQLKVRFQEGMLAVEEARFEEGCEVWLAAIDDARAWGASRREEMMREAASAFLRVIGREEEARQQAVIAGAMGANLNRPTHQVGLALLDYVTGRVDEGLEGLARLRALQTTRAVDAQWLARLTLTGRVVMEADRLERGDYEPLVDELCEQLSRGVLRQAQLAWFLEVAAVAAARGERRRRARALGARANDLYRGFGREDFAQRVRQRLHRAGGPAAVPA
jgi:hypothetical protein